MLFITFVLAKLNLKSLNKCLSSAGKRLRGFIILLKTTEEVSSLNTTETAIDSVQLYFFYNFYYSSSLRVHSWASCGQSSRLDLRLINFDGFLMSSFLHLPTEIFNIKYIHTLISFSNYSTNKWLDPTQSSYFRSFLKETEGF